MPTADQADQGREYAIARAGLLVLVAIVAVDAGVAGRALTLVSIKYEELRLVSDGGGADEAGGAGSAVGVDLLARGEVVAAIKD